MMTPEQALNILNQATEPNVRFTKADYVAISQAINVLAEFIKANSTTRPPKEVKESDDGK
jgi:hypothetical protein